MFELTVGNTTTTGEKVVANFHTVCHNLGMDTKRTPRQRDIDQRLRDATGLGLTDWLTNQRQSGTSYRSMSLLLNRITRDSVSDQTLRIWCRTSGVEAAV